MRRRLRSSMGLVSMAMLLGNAASASSSATHASDASPAARTRAASASPAWTRTPQARLAATARMWSVKHRDDLARQAIAKALLIAPSDPALLAQAIHIELRFGNARAAQAMLERLKAGAPSDVATLQSEDEFRAATSAREELATVRLLARSGRMHEAGTRLVALFPHGAPPGELGAEYYRILSGTPEGYRSSVAALRRRVAADPADTDAALVLAELLNRRDETRAEANRLASSLARRDDADHVAAMNLWRRVLRSAGADSVYADGLREFLRLAPGDSEFEERLARLDAQLEARRRLERNPDYIAEQQGLKALERGELAAADALLERAARARPGDADAVGGLGVLRLRQGRHAEARMLFQQAAALDAGDRTKWESLAHTALLWGTIAKGREAAAAGHADAAERAARAALAMDPDNAQAKVLLADAWFAQGNWHVAEPLLRELLAARQPNMGAVRSLQQLLLATGRQGEVEPLLDALEQRFRSAEERADLARMRAEVLAAEAQRLAGQGKSGPAAEYYERALRAEPNAPWTRFALARLYRDLGLPQLGRAVMDDGLAASELPEMRYAAALYRNSIDDVEGAHAVLAAVPEAARSDGMRVLARHLQAQQSIDAARRLLAAGEKAAGTEALERAATLGADDPYVTASVGALWIDAGEPDHGLALMRAWMAEHARETDADVRLRLGDLLGSADRDEELDALLRQLRRDDVLTAQQQARLEDQSLRLVLRRTERAMQAGDYVRARRLLDHASAAGKRDARYALEMADIEREQGHYAAAKRALEPVLAATPDDPQARLALARVLEQSGERTQALAIVRDVLGMLSPDEVDARLSAVRRLAALRRPQEARQITSGLRTAHPERADVTLEEGLLARDMGQYDEAASLYRTSRAQERASGVFARSAAGTPAQAAQVELEQRRDPRIEAGWMPAYKSGDAGVSDYHAQQVPIYVQVPYRYDGHFFFHLDAVHLDAGTLSLTNPAGYALETFGTYSAWATPGSASAMTLHQRADGVALGFGYQSDAWRFDLGTTPIGFPVHYFVGGVRYRFEAGPASFSVSVSRRPEIGSELSYAGLRDPWTNAVWGGVRRDGIDWHTGVDVGRVSVFADLGAGRLTGRHVAGNESAILRTGFTVPVYERSSMRVATGLVGNVWHYTNNLRFYTYGQGGYYSPQLYTSIGVPIEWSGRYGALRWNLTTTVGVSSSYERDSPYYPNGLPANLTAASAQTLSGLVYSGGWSGIGFSYGVRGAVQYRFGPRLTVGALIAIDHSNDYAPSSGMLYVRYSFDARKDDNGFQLSPVRLYSSY